MIRFNPLFPAADLDSSWAYAMNEAVARGLVFGKDIIFTFGPYASVYTAQFHPGTDTLMLGGSCLLAAAFGLGVVAVLPKGRWPYALLAPVLLAQLAVPDSFHLTQQDAIFLAIPLLFLLLASQNLQIQRLQLLCVVSLILLLLACALLPLVKGTFAGLSAAMVALVFLLAFSRNKIVASLGLLMYFAAIAIFWVISGQAITTLPGFFIAQAPIISGYTGAMTISGNPIEIIAYIVCATYLLWTLYRGYARKQGRVGLALVLGFALTLFFALKAGFVRHDVHAMIPVGLLLLAAWFEAFILPVRQGVACLLLAIFCGGFIASHYLDLSPSRDWERIVRLYRGIPMGIAKWVIFHDELNHEFQASANEIKKKYPLPVEVGTMDIYPVDQSALIASGMLWSPRPIVQSYSAYNPTLARINAIHLSGASAPDNILFSISPIDGRLPALEDGVSWPALLTDYTVAGYTNDRVLLKKNHETSVSFRGDEVFDSTVFAGQTIPLPQSSGPLWAEIEIRPSLLGKIATFLLKTQDLNISLQLKDGSSASYKYVPGMGEAGFLISPVVQNTQSFLMLTSTLRDSYFSSSGLPTAFSILGASLFWEREIKVRLWKANIPAQSQVDAMLLTPLRQDHPATFDTSMPSGECSIDMVNTRLATADVTTVSGVLAVSGWAIAARNQELAPDDIFISLIGEDHSIYYGHAVKYPRNDVNNTFNLPNMGDVGFHVLADISKLKGLYRLGIAQVSRGKLIDCPIRLPLNVE